MVNVAIFIKIGEEYKRIELYSDEKINVVSSVQDINDISKVYTDFSQSFTIPASKVNNAIFGHWYNNDIDNGFDSRTRKDAFIELDTLPFRTGKIQLDKSVIKKGVCENYQITFFGSLLSLKDAFNGRSLKEFDFSAYNFAYSTSEVVSRVTGGVTNDIKFPLISPLNAWEYGSGYNIASAGNPIYASELFPAMRVSKIFEVLANDLGITFQGNFLNDLRFLRAFLCLKNSEVFTPQFQRYKINFQTKSSVNGFLGTDMSAMFDLTNDWFTYNNEIGLGEFESSYLTITFTANSIPFKFHVYCNGKKISEQAGISSTSSQSLFIPYPQNGNYEFYISSSSPVTFTSLFGYSLYDSTLPIPNLIFSVGAVQSTSQTTASDLNISDLMPDIKAEDFFSGILKMFNLTCYSDTPNVFTIEQLENWYYSEGGDSYTLSYYYEFVTNFQDRVIADSGTFEAFDCLFNLLNANVVNTGAEIIDITKYCISDEITIDRVKPYKKIKFAYETSDSILNTEYLAIGTRPYGDLNHDLENDGEDYNVQLPFENMLFSKLATNLLVGYSLKSDLKPYIPKPMIVYDYGTIVTSDHFHLHNGVGSTSYTTYNMFSQDTSILSSIYTLNFGPEQSAFTNNIEPNTLFTTYYQAYLNNIYSLKARSLKIKAKLPIGILTTLKLNDRLVIRDKRYIINRMNIDLTSGEVDFDLMNDFRSSIEISPAPTSYAFNVTNGSSVSYGDACALSGFSLTLYGNQITFTANTLLYSDAALTTLYNGNNYYFHCNDGTYARISTVGVVSNTGTCSVTPPPPTPTPTGTIFYTLY